MTAKEAITMLRRIQEPEPYEPQINEAAFEALQMAINVLGKDINVPSNDCISRAAAIDMIRLYREDEVVDLDELESSIAMMPSAQPKIKCIAKVTLTDEQVKEAFEKAKCEILAAQPETAERIEESAQNIPNEDLISRQAAIDALDSFILDETTTLQGDTVREVLEALPSAQPDWGKPVGDGRPLADSEVVPRLRDIQKQIGGSYAIDRAIEVLEGLPSAQSEPHWIPCSERMPKEKDVGILKKLGTEKRSEYVLATVEVKSERMTVTACTYDGKWDWNMKYAFPDFKVIAWMPLPEPYKEPTP